MFTGIVESKAQVLDVWDHDGIRTCVLVFDLGFCDGLAVGGSVAVDGVCLTATEILNERQVRFDVMLKSLAITTLGALEQDSWVNVERAALDGAEIGGHPLSGHVDFTAQVVARVEQEGNCCLKFAVPPSHQKYIFAKGYIAVNGCSLTLAEVDAEGFEVWLIPETRRVTTFDTKQVGASVNVEIERSTQVVVDTVERTVKAELGPYYELLHESLQAQQKQLAQALTSKLNALKL